MSSEKLTVTSEIYSELASCYLSEISEKSIISYFKFSYPSEGSAGPEDHIQVDGDGDCVVIRRNNSSTNNDKVIKIGHSTATPIWLVGLQVWRGAFLLADYVLHHAKSLSESIVLELGSGVGLTGIVTSLVAEQVICTDVDKGGILQSIRSNVKLNSDLVKSSIIVTELDFYQREWEPNMIDMMGHVDTVLAADVIYDNDLTEAFVKTLTQILSIPPKKSVLVALEKRFVFTAEDHDVVAPCYEHFLSTIKKLWASPPMSSWKMEQLPIDFPQFFVYERTNHLVLWKISS